jgi:predicted phosphodiesterase
MSLSFITWSPTEVDTLIKLVEEGLSTEDISAQLTKKAEENIPGYLTPRSVRAVQRKKQKILRTKSNSPVNHNAANAQWERIKRTQKHYQTESKFDSTGVLEEPGRVKILSLSDIHFPFAHVDFLEKAIQDNTDADILVLNGDILDGYIYSTFDKDSTVAAIDEYNCASDFIALCAATFSQVVITYGNHDARAEKALKRTGMPREAYKIFGPNLLARIANGEKLDRNGMVTERKKYDNVFFPTSEPWWVQIGKTLFIHPHNRGSGKPGHTVTSWATKFRERLTPSSFDSVVCGHTHHAFKGISNGLLLIEQGCLSDYMSYAWNPTNLYLGNAAQGYAVIYQDEDGNTDFNQSDFHYFGQLFPVDKPAYNNRSFQEII